MSDAREALELLNTEAMKGCYEYEHAEAHAALLAALGKIERLEAQNARYRKLLIRISIEPDVFGDMATRALEQNDE